MRVVRAEGLWGQDEEENMTRAKRWSLKQIRSGRCGLCGKPREDNGTQRCDVCRDKRRVWDRERYQRVKR